MENIKSETKANVDQMKAELLRLNTKRAQWEGGAFKRSNEQLYAVLDVNAGLKPRQSPEH